MITFTLVLPTRYRIDNSAFPVPVFAVRVADAVWEIQDKSGDLMVGDGFESLEGIAAYLDAESGWDDVIDSQRA